MELWFESSANSPNRERRRERETSHPSPNILPRAKGGARGGVNVRPEKLPRRMSLFYVDRSQLTWSFTFLLYVCVWRVWTSCMFSGDQQGDEASTFSLSFSHTRTHIGTHAPCTFSLAWPHTLDTHSTSRAAELCSIFLHLCTLRLHNTQTHITETPKSTKRWSGYKGVTQVIDSRFIDQRNKR